MSTRFFSLQQRYIQLYLSYLQGQELLGKLATQLHALEGVLEVDSDIDLASLREEAYRRFSQEKILRSKTEGRGA